MVEGDAGVEAAATEQVGNRVLKPQTRYYLVR